MEYRQFLRENYKKTKAEITKERGESPSKAEVYGILKKKYKEGLLPANELPKQPTVTPILSDKPKPSKQRFDMKAIKQTAAFMISF